MSATDELLMTEMLFSGVFNEAEPAQLAALLSCLVVVGDNKKDDKKGGRARGSDHHGGSDSSSSDDDRGGEAGAMMQKGLSSIRNLKRIRRRIRRDPGRIIRRFERKVRDELGVAPGGGWTLLDWIKVQRWGKLAAMKRCAVMDSAVLHALRAGRHEEATAQTVQKVVTRRRARKRRSPRVLA